MADSPEEVIYDYLTTDTTFMANYTGVYYIDAPESTANPYIVFFMVDDTGVETKINQCSQGEARIQFNLWDDNKNRGRKLRTTLRNKINALGEVRGGYFVMTTGITEQTLQKASGTDSYQYIVDGIIKWNTV
jgi:hypothetical protein